MQRTYGQSATRRRLDAQREKLDALEPDAAITAIQPTHDELGRVHFCVKKDRFGPVHPRDYETLDLTIGSVLDDDARDQLFFAIATEAARTDALRLLGARSRARQDLLKRLIARGHHKSTAGAAIERLEAVGLIDDAAFAQDKAAHFVRAKKLGPRAAGAKLRALGLDASLVTRAIDDAFAGLDLTEQATGAARKRLRALPPTLDMPTKKRRLYAFLIRRGYDHSTCAQATQTALLANEPDLA